MPGPKGNRASRGVALGTAVFLLFGLFAIGTVSAAADESPIPPLYDSGMTFGAIHGPADPEEYSWTVNLHDQQVLEEIDDRHAEVTDEGHPSFGITAELAHDAVGSAVPTTLAVSGKNVITLTVHHRAGNPAAGGAPFVYPITGGAGWEGGFRTIIVPMPGPEPMPGASTSSPAAAPGCIVPRLKGRSLKADRQRLRDAGCRLGEVRGLRAKTAKVVRQSPWPGKVLAAGAAVSVKLGD